MTAWVKPNIKALKKYNKCLEWTLNLTNILNNKKVVQTLTLGQNTSINLFHLISFVPQPWRIPTLQLACVGGCWFSSPSSWWLSLCPSPFGCASRSADGQTQVSFIANKANLKDKICKNLRSFAGVGKFVFVVMVLWFPADCEGVWASHYLPSRAHFTRRSQRTRWDFLIFTYLCWRFRTFSLGSLKDLWLLPYAGLIMLFVAHEN